MYSNKNINDKQMITDLALIALGTLKKEFRAMDVIYLIELFGDLLQSSQYGQEIQIFAMQIDRIVKELIDKEYAVEYKRSNKRFYSLNKSGVLHLVEQTFKANRYQTIGETLFLEYITKSYGDFFLNYLKDKFELTIDEQATVEKVLYSDNRLKRQMQFVDDIMEDLEGRIKSADNMVDWMQERSTKSFDEIVSEMPTEFGHRLSYRKSLKELIGSLPAELARFEMTQGASARRDDYYTRKLKVFGRHKDVLRGLLEG
tara:strand:- start:732 stop:1505 length:774 start_codon:yes stop_codon:yes gene_type:complete